MKRVVASIFIAAIMAVGFAPASNANHVAANSAAVSVSSPNLAGFDWLKALVVNEGQTTIGVDRYYRHSNGTFDLMLRPTDSTFRWKWADVYGYYTGSGYCSTTGEPFVLIRGPYYKVLGNKDYRVNAYRC